MKKMNYTLPFAQRLVVLALACASFVTLHAQVANPRISIQGTLKDASGIPVADGDYNVTFKLYNVESGGTALWSETDAVEVVGGIYSHYLGSVTALDGATFATKVYLGVTVKNFELTPRTELTYAPYAFSVNTAQTVVCSGALGDVKYSILNPTQFAAVNGSCWVPMDGRALASTDLLRVKTGMTTVPNAGGLFIRAQEINGSDNDPDRGPNDAVATVQADGFKNHTHPFSGTTNSDGTHSHSVPMRIRGNEDGNNEYTYASSGGFDAAFNTASGGAHSHAFSGTTNNSSTGNTNETRPKNINLYVYIRIN